MEMFHVPHREVIQAFIAVFILFFLVNCTPNKYTCKNRNPKTFQDYCSEYYNREKIDNLNWSSEDEILEFDDRNNRNKNRQVIRKRSDSKIKKSNKRNYHKSYSSSKPKKNKNTRNQKKRFFTYKIKKGDTLYKISRRFNVSINKICQFNKIKNNNNIKAGKNLKIPLSQYKYAQNKKPDKNKPSFRWPLSKISHVKRDGQDGIHAIGIMITGRYRSCVVSSASGKVEKIGRMRGFGRYVIIKHAHRYLTIYSNLKEIFVSEGDTIMSGKEIGIISNRNLHFQIDYKGKPTNPLHYLPHRG
ncbi:MAG: LysM peptidoglycan-binding domain-containing M23 family metallopeptidase [Spirochaetota bacterium]|nr:LysM peptidoglycan-binding domain-containing M23 family metallopeptidase [Spirochaetota bacterium]